MLDTILNQLEEIHKFYDEVDFQTNQISEDIINIKYEEQLDLLITNSQKIIDKLIATLKLTTPMATSSAINNIDQNGVLEINKAMNNLNTQAETGNKLLYAHMIKKLKALALYIFAGIAFAIVLAFVVMYIRIRRAMQYKRVL